MHGSSGSADKKNCRCSTNSQSPPLMIKGTNKNSLEQRTIDECFRGPEFVFKSTIWRFLSRSYLWHQVWSAIYETFKKHFDIIVKIRWIVKPNLFLFMSYGLRHELWEKWSPFNILYLNLTFIDQICNIWDDHTDKALRPICIMFYC